MPVRILAYVATALLTSCIVIFAQNVALSAFFPYSARVATDFSPAYLQARFERLAAGPRPIVFLGDSVWWGYGLPADRTAIAALRARGCDACTNLAFKSGSPINDYGLVRLMRSYGVAPAVVYLEINQKVFNPVDDADQKLHPAIATLLSGPLPPAISTLYAMRADVRALLFGEDAPPQTHRLTADDFQGTYDLGAYDAGDPAVVYLTKTVALLQAERVPFVAVMTPTNRALVADYVDTPEYRANGAYLARIVERHGGKVLDLENALPPDDFIDNAHLNARGQQRLATILARSLR